MRYEAHAFNFEDDELAFPALGTIDVPFAAAPDLAGPDRFVSPARLHLGHDQPFDLDGHGTHVAGTVGQLTNNGVGDAGMAFNVRIMPVKVMASAWDDIFGSPRIGTDDVVARGIRYAVDNGAKVINLSIGRQGVRRRPCTRLSAYAVANGAFVVGGRRKRFRRRERRSNATPSSLPTSREWSRWGRSAGTGSARSTRTAGPYIELVAPGGDYADWLEAAGAFSSRRSTSIWSTPSRAGRPDTARPGSTRSPMNSSRERRWRLLTWPGSPRCSCSRESRALRRLRLP